MSDDNNIIFLFGKKNGQRSKLDQEFTDDDTAWENMVDLSLQDHQVYIEQLIEHQKQLSMVVSDLSRDIMELKKAVSLFIRYMK